MAQSSAGSHSSWMQYRHSLMTPQGNADPGSGPKVFLRLEEDHRINCYAFCPKVCVFMLMLMHIDTHMSLHLCVYFVDPHISRVCVHVYITYISVYQTSKLLKKYI